MDLLSPERLARLASLLHAPATPVDDLPVLGYRASNPEGEPDTAAVLLLMVRYPEPGVVMTVRSRDLTKHAGQVALPGGRREIGEHFPLATALREAKEEIGIGPEQVRILGLLDQVDTISNFRITPVVGVADSSADLMACPDEVREVFTLPLEWVLDPDRYRRHQVVRGGRSFDMWSMAGGHWPIWGATATILQHLARLSREP